MLEKKLSQRLSPLLGVLALSTSCTDKPTQTIYQDVSATSQWSSAGHLTKTYGKGENIPNHLERDGKLYILIQSVEPNFLINKVKQKVWTDQDRAQLIKKTPQFSDEISHSPWLKQVN